MAKRCGKADHAAKLAGGDDLLGLPVRGRQALVVAFGDAGQGQAQDFLALARRVRETVAERFGLWMEMEPVLVGREGVVQRLT